MRRKFKPRKYLQSGYALVSILILGFVTLLFLTGMYGLILSVFRAENSGRAANELRMAAESGIDFGIKTLNDSIKDRTAPSPLDSGIVSLVPSNYLPSLDGLTVKIRVRKLSSSDWVVMRQYSSIYSPLLDYEKGPSPAFGNIDNKNYSDTKRSNVTEDHWRVLESTASRGLFSRSVRVYLEPRFDKPFGVSDFPVPGATTPNFFKNTFFGNTSVNISPTQGKSTVISEQAKPTTNTFPLSVKTNMNATIGPGAKIVGDLSITNNKLGAPPEIATINGTLDGRVLANSGVDSYAELPPTSAPDTFNVRADADFQMINSTNTRTSPNDTPASLSQGAAQIASQIVPSSPSAMPLPDFSSGTTLSGSYNTSSLITSNSSSPAKVTGNVNLYLQDGASAEDALNIDASKIQNSNPTDLKIWYNGNRPITINLDADFNGMIYAPNAPITITGTKSFDGALVGDRINLLNGSTDTSSPSVITIRTSKEQSNSVMPDEDANFQVSSSTSNSPILQGYRAVTWEDLVGSLVN